MSDELALGAIEWAWSEPEPDRRAFYVWMVTSSMERNRIALESLAPTRPVASRDGNTHATAEHAPME